MLDATQARSRVRDHSSEVGPQELHVVLLVSRILDAVTFRRCIHALPRLRFMASTSPVGIVTQFRNDRSTSCKRGSNKRNGRHGVTRSVPTARMQSVHARGECRGGAPQSLVLVFGGPLLGAADRQQ